MHRHLMTCRQLIAGTLIASLIMTLSVPVQAGVGASTAWPAASLSGIPIPPTRLGVVTGQFVGASGRRVILIQDLHSSREVQKHIQQLLAFYDEQIPGLAVGVEGASGPLDYSSLAAYPHPQWKTELVDFLRDSGEITGTEAYAIEANRPTLLTGLENDKYFRYHLELFRRSYEERAALYGSLERLRSEMASLKSSLVPRRRYSALLARLKSAEYELEKIQSLLRQQVTQEEARSVIQRLPDSLELLNTLIPLLSSDYQLPSNEIEEAVRSSLDFYAAAILRDQPLSSGMVQLLRERPTGLMVAGGFHTEGIIRQLRDAGVSYVLITPQLRSLSPQEERQYVDRLMGRPVTEAEIDASARRALGLVDGVAPRIVDRWTQIRRTFPTTKRILSYLWKDTYGGTNPPPFSSDNAKRLTPDDWAHVEYVSRKLGYKDYDKIYMAGMYEQKLYPRNEKLKIVYGGNDGNFKLAVDLTDEERRSILGSVDYGELPDVAAGDPVLKNVVLTVNSLDGGIGDSIRRLEWLKEQARRELVPEEQIQQIRMGAKGTDLAYDIRVLGRSTRISIAEAKLLQLIMKAQQNTYAAMYFQPLVNIASKKSYVGLMDDQYFFDRINPDKRDDEKFTYEGFMDIAHLRRHSPDWLLMQADLPGFDLQTGQLESVARQPGGHGQWGVRLLWHAYKLEPRTDGHQYIRVFSNGDNVQSPVDDRIVKEMIEKNIPIIKLTTPATPIDRKGGKDGVRIVHIDGRTEYVPEQMEKQDAENADKEEPGQLSRFYEAGQKGAEKGRQPFNTNIIYFNETLIHKLLVDLAHTIGEEALVREISPTRIPKLEQGKDYEPIDGAMGSAIHNLNTFFQTALDSRIQAILTKHGVSRLLRFVNVPRRFFTPVKTTFDIWWQRNSDFYRFDTGAMTLVPVDPSIDPPDVDIPQKKEDPYGTELLNYEKAFGHSSTIGLRSLYLRGPFHLPDSILKGQIRLINQSKEMVNLYDERFRKLLKGYFLPDGKLQLQDVSISVDENGSMQVKTIQSEADPGTYRPWQVSLAFVGTLAGAAVAFLTGTPWIGSLMLFVGIFKQAYLLRRVGYWGMLDLEPVESIDLETGIVTGLTGVTPVAHALRSHGAFRVKSEILAHSLDVITIPIEFLHAVITRVLLWIAPAAIVQEIREEQKPLADALGSEKIARLLPPGSAAVQQISYGANGQVIPGVVQAVVPLTPSHLAGRLKRLLSFNQSEARLLSKAYQQLAIATNA